MLRLPTRAIPARSYLGLTAEVHNQVVKYLCEELTSTETVFPCTDLRLVYEIAGSG